MREYFAYIRVSTVRQGEKGASLPEQRTVISSYAQREGIVISRWFEERETAAKVGRTEFRTMLTLLGKGMAHGLLLHKIDRGARNLKDWAALAELSDSGIDVRIAGDSIDLSSRGGRLSADIQAVVAADYIRNLREEVKKGQRGRLGQGLYPWPAPIGYLSAPGNQPKPIDPAIGPLVRQIFDEYATGTHSLHTLARRAAEIGLKSSTGKPISINSLNILLRRRFYIGVIDVKGQLYIGLHEPLISVELFEQVQQILDRRSKRRVFGIAKYALRELLHCRECGRTLYAETQKGKAYFRCHTKTCIGVSIRESKIIDELSAYARDLRLTDESLAIVQELFQAKKKDMLDKEETSIRARQLKKDNIRKRLDRVTDAYIDQQIDKDEHARRRAALVAEEVQVDHLIRKLEQPGAVVDATQKKVFELGKDLQILAETENIDETARILKNAISNCVVSGKSVVTYWKYPLYMMILHEGVLVSGDDCDAYRTIHLEKINILIEVLLEEAVNPQGIER